MTSVRAVLLLLFLPPVVHAALAENLIPSVDVRLTDMHGPVLLTTMDGKTKGTPPAYTPFALAEGDFIKTGSSATAEIAFTGGTLIRLGPDSALRLNHITPPTIELVLKSGVLLARVHFEKDEGDQFRVITPSAVATVRGTEFVVEESGSRARIAVLDEGHVAVTAPGFKKEVLMHFNQETQVPRGLSPQNAHVLERLYHHKIQMAEMRQRIKVIRKQWKTPAAPHLQQIRAAWIKRNTPTHHAASHHHHYHSQ